MAELVAGVTVLKLEEFLPYRLAVLSSSVSRVLTQAYAHHNLGTSEWLVLMTLGEIGAMTAKALGAKHHMHKTKVSRAVAALLERELIWRRSNDADLRQSFLHHTPRGKSLYEECAPLAVDVMKRLETAIPAADREAFDRCLDKLAARSRQLTVTYPATVLLRG